MSYSRTSLGASHGFGVAAPQDVQDRSVIAARPRLGDLLAALEEISNSNLKLLPSNNTTVAGQTCSGTLCQNVTSPTLWDGSNVVVWPVSDYNNLAAAWAVCQDFVGFKGAFALDLTNVAKAIVATRALIAAVDVKMAFRGLSIKRSSTNYLPFLLAGLGVIGLALATRKSKKGVRRKRRR